MLIVITLDRARGGAGPTLFSYDKRTDQVTVVGPLFDQASPLSWATGEGWYWSATLPTKLYVNQGPRLSRYDVLSRQLETVFDVAAQFGPDRYIWQMPFEQRRPRAFRHAPLERDLRDARLHRLPRGHPDLPLLSQDRRLRRVPGRQERPVAPDQGERRRRPRRGQSDRRPRGGHRDAVPRPGGSRRPLRHRPRLHGGPGQLARAARRRPRVVVRPAAARRAAPGRARVPDDGLVARYRTHLPRQCAARCAARSAVRVRRPGEPLDPPSRQRDRVLPPRRVSPGAGGGAHDDRPQRGRRGPERLREAPEGQPRRHGPVLHLDEQCGEQSSGRLRRQGAVAPPGVERRHRAPRWHGPGRVDQRARCRHAVSAAVVVSAAHPTAAASPEFSSSSTGSTSGPRSRHRPSPRSGTPPARPMAPTP